MNTQIPTTKKLGNNGELLVEEHLINDGFWTLARNYTTRRGEVDLIAQKDDLVVFVEVKARRSQQIDPAELISPAKQRRIGMAARHFIAINPNLLVSYRFDVALVDFSNTDQYQIQYIEHAFTLAD